MTSPRFKKTALSLSLILALAGCTIAPKPIPAPAVPALDGNSFTGGIIDLGPPVPKGQPPIGPAHVTAGWVMAYNSLAAKYGQDLEPRVRPGDGITDPVNGIYAVSLRTISDKNTMQGMSDMGLPP